MREKKYKSNSFLYFFDLFSFKGNKNHVFMNSIKKLLEIFGKYKFFK